MSNDANAHLWFGFVTHEEYVAPWHTEEWEREINDWWAEGYSKKTFDSLEDKEEWLIKNPCPIKEIPIGSTAYHKYWFGLALADAEKETGMAAVIDIDLDMGRPINLFLEQKLLDILEKLGIPVEESKIGWKLSAWYG